MLIMKEGQKKIQRKNCNLRDYQMMEGNHPSALQDLHWRWI